MQPPLVCNKNATGEIWLVHLSLHQVFALVHGSPEDAISINRLRFNHRHTGLLRLAEVLRESVYGSVAITLLFAVAAVCNCQPDSGWLAQRGAERLRNAAVVSIYGLAGVPAAVDLIYDLASLHIDTHVLMTLAVIGTLLIGGALEVCLRPAFVSLSAAQHSTEDGMACTERIQCLKSQLRCILSMSFLALP